VKAHPAHAEAGEAGSQCVAKGARAAEPDVGPSCVAVALVQQFCVQCAVAVGADDVQPHRGQCLAQGLEAGGEGVVGAHPGAVVKIGIGHVFGALQGFEPGKEGGDADAAGDPDLPGTCGAPAEIETPVGAFDGDWLSVVQALAETAGVVAECLDLEGDATIPPVCTGNGERMGTLKRLEGGKGKLAGFVAFPA